MYRTFPTKGVIEMTNKVGAASALGRIEHTEDLIAAVMSGRVNPENIPPELDSPAVRALVEAIRGNPNGPYVALISPGKEAKFDIEPGAGKCRGCGASIAIIYVSVGNKPGWLAVEDETVRIDPPTLTQEDFRPNPVKFDPKFTFGDLRSRTRRN